MEMCKNKEAEPLFTLPLLKTLCLMFSGSIANGSD
jgi:hypothetical protein